MNPKILAIGHSWVQEIERQYYKNPIKGPVITFASCEWVDLKGIYDMVLNVLTPQHTHVLVFALISEAFRKYYLSSEQNTQKYYVVVPSSEFDPQVFAQHMTYFVERCQQVSRNIKVILVIPPRIDLIYYNRLQVDNFPRHVQQIYNGNSSFKDRNIFDAVFQTYKKIAVLQNIKINWPGKILYDVQNVVYKLNHLQPVVSKFMNGEVFSMGRNSYLCDGLHPTAELTTQMWRRLFATMIKTEHQPLQSRPLLPSPPSAPRAYQRFLATHKEGYDHDVSQQLAHASAAKRQCVGFAGRTYNENQISKPLQGHVPLIDDKNYSAGFSESSLGNKDYEEYRAPSVRDRNYNQEFSSFGERSFVQESRTTSVSNESYRDDLTSPRDKNYTREFSEPVYEHDQSYQYGSGNEETPSGHHSHEGYMPSQHSSMRVPGSGNNPDKINRSASPSLSPSNKPSSKMWITPQLVASEIEKVVMYLRGISMGSGQSVSVTEIYQMIQDAVNNKLH